MSKRVWTKSNVSYKMAGVNHPKGIKISFANVADGVLDQQLIAFGKILETLSNGDQLDFAALVDNHQVYAELN